MNAKDVQERVLSILEKLNHPIRSNISDRLSLDYMNIFLSIYMRGDIESVENWKKIELNRQKGKTISNRIGDFHEMMVASFPNWIRVKDLKIESLKKYNTYKGLDVINEKKKIAFEIKNKHNSINSGSLREIIRTFKSFKKKNKWNKVYIVTMLPKSNSSLAINGIETRKTKVDGRYIEVNYISGSKMYGMVTGDSNFHKKLITNIFPKALNLSEKDSKYITEIYQDVYKE